VKDLTLRIDSEKIASIIGKQLKSYKKETSVEEIGIVTMAGDGIARISGLPGAMAGEMLEFKDGVYGLALNLDRSEIGAIILGDSSRIQEGHPVKCTGRILEVPVGDKLIGRVIDPLGRPLDGKGPVKKEAYRPIEYGAPDIVSRQPVKEPLQTGIKAIDSMIPIGRGQRELVIGDRSTGKTAILIDTILNQKDKGVTCIYVAIGQKTSNVAKIIDRLKRSGAMEYTIVVSASARYPASIQYIAPYAGCAIGEYFMYKGQHALILYDDLSKQAAAYRELSLLLRRPPGRKAYPGDIFYLHSRLLERSAKLTDELGGGSMTAIPVIETKANDISAYIPTNVISITDGQIYLETDLFNAGMRPAINASISVSRVGANAQVEAMKKVTGTLRLDLSQYRELETFAKFGTELGPETKKQLARGEKTMEILKQDQYEPMDVMEQVLIIFALTEGYLDELELDDISDFEKRYLEFMRNCHPDIIKQLKEKNDITEDLNKRIREVIENFIGIFKHG
jgi:F-type H+/Na+-transporting ATPase subunit alpha